MGPAGISELGCPWLPNYTTRSAEGTALVPTASKLLGFSLSPRSLWGINVAKVLAQCCSVWPQTAPATLPTPPPLPPPSNHGAHGCLRLAQAHEPPQLQSWPQGPTQQNVQQLPFGTIRFPSTFTQLAQTGPRL